MTDEERQLPYTLADDETLESKLAEVREAFNQFSKPLIEAKHRMVAALERTHIPQVVDIGERAPDFTLKTAHSGETVHLSDAVKHGPVVLAFYRGNW